MTDRELLELAKKAAGVFGDYVENRAIQGAIRTGIWDGLNEYCWNPLTNDADALRLMARLNINVHYRENLNGAFVIADRHDIQVCAESLDGPHEDDATRRVIVRAAAEIGKVGNL